jgi:hypothetical protein
MVDQIKPSLSIPSLRRDEHLEADDPLSSVDESANPAVELCRILNRIWHLERLVLGSAAVESGKVHVSLSTSPAQV